MLSEENDLSIIQHKIIIVLLTIFLVSAIALPFIQQDLIPKKSPQTSELWILGQQYTTAHYPYNISSNQNYTVFLNAKNNLEKTVQYMIQVKFFNKTQYDAADSTRTLHSTTAVVDDRETWVLPVDFSIDYAFDGDISQMNLNHIILNNAQLDVSDFSIAWDSLNEGYFGFLYFELWLYDDTIGKFVNHGRSVTLQLNLLIT